MLHLEVDQGVPAGSHTADPALVERFLSAAQREVAVLGLSTTWLVLRGDDGAKRIVLGPKVGVDVTLVPVEATAAKLQWHRWPQRAFAPGGINAAAIKPFAAALADLLESRPDDPEPPGRYVVVGTVRVGGDTYFQIAHGRVQGDAFVREEIVGDQSAVLDAVDAVAPKAVPSDSHRRRVVDLILRDRELYDAQAALRSKAKPAVYEGVPNEWLVRVIEAERDAIAREVTATFDDCGLVDLEDLPEIIHSSDCATHNMPAMPNGPCDCGAEG